MMLLDYGRPDPFGQTIGRSRHLAWPANAYRVTLPNSPEHGERLNALERVMVRLIDAGVAPDTRELSVETCLPHDLVQCVLLRLRDKGFVDEHGRIIQRHRSRWENDEETPRDFVTALVFRELATGKILPFLHLLSDDHPLKLKEGEERFFRRIRWNEEHTKSPPGSRDVISALRTMQKRAQALGPGTGLPSLRQITIAPQPERYLLDCPIAIQRSDAEFRIADPFGNGFALVLESAFSQILDDDQGCSEWLLNWRQSLSNARPGNLVTVRKDTFDTDTNRGRYPALIENLNAHSRRGKQFRSIEQIHSAIEWAMFYSCAHQPYAAAVQQLSLTHPSEHRALLHRAAEELSLALPFDGLRPIWGGKLEDFLSGKAELGTVLALALLIAAHDAQHPMRRLASRHTDLILRLLEMKKHRDEIGHGARRVRVDDVELPEEALMRDVVSTLLPAVAFSVAEVPGVDREAIADSLLDARTSIQSEFGFTLFNRLGANLQDFLIAAERFWLSSSDGEDAQSLAWDAYAAVQGAFRGSLSGRLPPDTSNSEYSLHAQRIAHECGLGPFPECLSTVKRSAIQEALQGNYTTLGACMLAFFLVSDGEDLRSIAQTHSSFVLDVAHVIDRRGHGNTPIPMSKDEMRRLRKAAYSTVKTLLES